MNQLNSWLELIRCYKKNIVVLFGNWLLIVALMAITNVLVLGILYGVALLFSLPVGEFAIPRWETIFSGTMPTYYTLMYVWALPYLAWIMYGWCRFLLHLVRTGCNDYALIYSTPLHRLLSAIGLGIVYMVPFVLTKYILTLPYEWYIILLYILYVVMLSRMLFAWYYLIDGASPWQALVHSNRHAQKHLFVTLLAAAVQLTSFAWPIKKLSESLGSHVMLIIVGTVGIFLILFFEYVIARLYAETECKTHKDCPEIS